MEQQRTTDALTSLRQDPFFQTNYEIQELLGQGCFGKIVKAKNKQNNKTIALKLQRFKKSKIKMVLKNQIDILKKLQGKQGIPLIFKNGDWDNGTFLELQLLSHDLNRTQDFSSTQITDLALEALKILEGVHNSNVVHQDLKPHNLMRNQNGVLYLIDFGLARNLPLRRTRPLIKGFIGTPRYASVRAHNMLEQGKRDDLESLFYNLAYLYYKKLPWSKLSVPSDQRLQKIKLLKMKHRSTLFLQMPPMFQRAFEYITSLEAYEEPNYSQLKGYFRRNKTVILEPTIKINGQQREKVKRISLNPSNFLQVPQSPFMTQKKKKDELIQRMPSIGKLSSLSSFSNYSDAVQTQLLQLVEPQEQQNYKEDENIEPELPSTHKIKSLVFKNPFGMH